MALERLHTGASGDLPDPDGTIVGPRRQPAAIRRDGHRSNRQAMALERLRTGASGDLPDPDGMIEGPRRQPAAVRRDGYRADPIALWPSSVCVQAPVATSQILTV